MRPARRLPRSAALLAVLFLTLVGSGCTDDGATTALDTLIINGLVYDGSAAEPTRRPVGILGDRILMLEGDALATVQAEQVIDASGLIVTPGFIDPHTHSLADLLSSDRNGNLNYLTQGVTTVFVGNDGGGSPHIGQLRERLQGNGIGSNVAFFVGHGEVRREVMGLFNRAPSADELREMQDLVRGAMRDGALGFSTGLYYTPGNYAATQEVVELARVAAEFGGVYDTHLRDESSYSVGFLAALEEAIRIGREADIHVHLAHIKALGVDVWGESAAAIKRIEAAQASGISVTADQYPWLASGTHMRNAVMPRWALADSEESYQARLRSPELIEQLRGAIAENIRRRGGAEALLIATCPDQQFVGKTLQDVAVQLELPPAEAALHVLRLGRSRVISFNMSMADVEQFMRQPWVMTSSDGNQRHPRMYASFPRKYQEFVQERGVITLLDFVHRSSGFTADTFGLSERGYLRDGYFADIAIIDPDNFRARADYLQWDRLSTGVAHLWVNGQQSIADGVPLNTLTGRTLSPQR